MDSSDRENQISRTEQILHAMGHDVGQLCAELYDMRPRQFVEEHRILLGMMRYMRYGDPEYLRYAIDDFIRHDRESDAFEKYIPLAYQVR